MLYRFHVERNVGQSWARIVTVLFNRFVTGDIQALLFVLVGLPHFCGGGQYLTHLCLRDCVMFIISIFLMSGELKASLCGQSHISSYHFISCQSRQQTSATSRRASGPVSVEIRGFRDKRPLHGAGSVVNHRTSANEMGSYLITPKLWARSIYLVVLLAFIPIVLKSEHRFPVL